MGEGFWSVRDFTILFRTFCTFGSCEVDSGLTMVCVIGIWGSGQTWWVDDAVCEALSSCKVDRQIFILYNYAVNCVKLIKFTFE